jgi:hypothetical protein
MPRGKGRRTLVSTPTDLDLHPLAALRPEMSKTEARLARLAEAAPRAWTKGPRCAQDFADVVNRHLDRITDDTDDLESHSRPVVLGQPAPIIGTAPAALPAPTPAEFLCTSCDRELNDDELVTVYQCSVDGCEEIFDGTENGRNCPSCNRPFSRVLTYQGCPDCLDEDSVERLPEAGVPA